MGGAYDAASPTLRAEGKDSCSRTIPREPDHRNSDMEDTKNQHKPKGTRKDPGELRVVSIDFNPPAPTPRTGCAASSPCSSSTP